MAKLTMTASESRVLRGLISRLETERDTAVAQATALAERIALLKRIAALAATTP